MSAQLPAQPHLDVLKKQARQLLNDHQAGASEAVSRVQAALADLPPSASEAFTLRHAQQVLAHEYGFNSWQALVDHVGRSGSDAPDGSALRLPDLFDQLARDLVAAQREDRLPSFGQLGEAFRGRLAAVGEDGDEAGGDVALEQARLAVAAINGCDSWGALATAISEAARTPLVDRPQLQSFERLHENYAPLVARRVAAMLGGDRAVEADVAFIDRTTYGEFILSLGPGTQSYRCTVDGLGNDIVLAVGPALAESLIGPGKGEATPRAQDLGEGLARDLEEIWRPLTPFSITSVALYTDPWAVGVAPMYETCPLCAIEVNADVPDRGLSGRLVEICYPVSAIRGVLDRLPVVG